MKTLRKRPYLLPFVVVYLLLTACNTVEGVGRDIEAAGDAIEDSARDNMY